MYWMEFSKVAHAWYNSRWKLCLKSQFHNLHAKTNIIEPTFLNKVCIVHAHSSSLSARALDMNNTHYEYTCFSYTPDRGCWVITKQVAINIVNNYTRYGLKSHTVSTAAHYLFLSVGQCRGSAERWDKVLRKISALSDGIEYLAYTQLCHDYTASHPCACILQSEGLYL